MADAAVPTIWSEFHRRWGENDDYQDAHGALGEEFALASLNPPALAELYATLKPRETCRGACASE